MLGLASNHARVSLWLHEARLNRWTELTKLQLSIGHIVRTTALVARSERGKDSEAIDFVSTTTRPPCPEGRGGNQLLVQKNRTVLLLVLQLF